MDLIAREAQVGRRTLYNLFESKEALFDATLERLWKKNPLADIVAGFDDTLSPEEGLAQVGMSIAQFWVPDEAIAYLRMIICESIRLPELARSFVATGRNPGRLAIAGYIQKLNEAGLLDTPDPDFARSQFVDLILGMGWNRVLGEPDAPSEERLEHVVSEAVKMFMARYGVCKSPELKDS